MRSSCLYVCLCDSVRVEGALVACMDRSVFQRVHTVLHCGAVCGPQQVRVEWQRGLPNKNTCCKQEVGL